MYKRHILQRGGSYLCVISRHGLYKTRYIGTHIHRTWSYVKMVEIGNDTLTRKANYDINIHKSRWNTNNFITAFRGIICPELPFIRLPWISCAYLHCTFKGSNDEKNITARILSTESTLCIIVLLCSKLQKNNRYRKIFWPKWAQIHLKFHRFLVVFRNLFVQNFIL